MRIWLRISALLLCSQVQAALDIAQVPSISAPGPNPTSCSVSDDSRFDALELMPEGLIEKTAPATSIPEPTMFMAAGL